MFSDARRGGRRVELGQWGSRRRSVVADRSVGGMHGGIQWVELCSAGIGGSTSPFNLKAANYREDKKNW